MSRKSKTHYCSNSYKKIHDELMSGSFWLVPDKIDIDFYNPITCDV